MPAKPASDNDCGAVAAKNGQSAKRRLLHPGEAGYPLWMDHAHTSGHITEHELDSVLCVHRHIWAHQAVAP